MGILVTSGDSFTYGDELEGSRNGKGHNFDTHHHLTYTHKLAEKLGVDYVNLGANGSSNQKIFRRTMDFLQRTSKDIEYMVVIWSSWGRIEVCEPIPHQSNIAHFIHCDYNMNQIIPNHYSSKLKFQLNQWPDKETEETCLRVANEWFQHIYRPHTAVFHSLNYMRTVQHMCDLMGIKIIQGIIHNGLWVDVLHIFRNAYETSQYSEYIEYLTESFSYLRPECQWGFHANRLDMTSIAEDNEGCFIHPRGHPCEKSHTIYSELLYNKFNEISNVTD